MRHLIHNRRRPSFFFTIARFGNSNLTFDALSHANIRHLTDIRLHLHFWKPITSQFGNLRSTFSAPVTCRSICESLHFTHHTQPSTLAFTSTSKFSLITTGCANSYLPNPQIPNLDIRRPCVARHSLRSPHRARLARHVTADIIDRPGWTSLDFAYS